MIMYTDMSPLALAQRASLISLLIIPSQSLIFDNHIADPRKQYPQYRRIAGFVICGLLVGVILGLLIRTYRKTLFERWTARPSEDTLE
jgi:hypothetical protein